MTQEQVSKLKELLSYAVYLVLDLVPERYRSALWEIARTSPPSRGAKLRDQLVAQIVDDLKRAKSEKWEDMMEQRAPCPLCNRSSSAPYANGFTVPRGIEQHLTGSGNAHRCEVIALMRRYAGTR